MKIAIIGAGFTGLSAAFTLTKLGHAVFVFEKENILGGLAGTFKQEGWAWAVEKHYHHWFTNDDFALNLIAFLGLTKYLHFPKTLTSIYYLGKIYPFDSAIDVLSFTPLSFDQRLRLGLVTAFLKILPKELGLRLEHESAFSWLKRFYGEKIFKIIWQPLLLGKFGPYAKTVNMTWFWARIKKRTPRLGYLEGGYQRLVDALAEKIKKQGGEILLKREFNPAKEKDNYDKIIVTTPSKVFIQMFPLLPKDYQDKLESIHHLHALNLVLITKEKFLKETYWLNINDKDFPFIGIIQQTNMMGEKYYGGNHITWVANYLPPGHPYLKMTKEELFNIYLPFLKKINPFFNFALCTLNCELFFGPFAQPVMQVNYSHVKPGFQTPLPNIYLANMDMVYPWDRGTNYAIELGEKIANLIHQRKI